MILDTLRAFWKFEPLERFLASLTQGRTYGTFITKLAPNHYQYGKGTKRHVLRDGIHYELDLSDIVDWYIYFGFIDPARKHLYPLLRPGDVVVDIGANVGDISMHFARIVGPSGRVLAFEPHPLNHTRMKRNLELNHFNNIVLERVGLGARPGRFAIKSIEEGNQGMNRIVADDAAGHMIEVTTLDDHLASRPVPRLDLIKIDVEGFELNVLQGAEQVLRRFWPILFIELDDRNLREQDTDARGLIRFLEKIGYTSVRADNGAVITAASDLHHCHFDIIAKHLFWPKTNLPPQHPVNLSPNSYDSQALC